LTDRKSDGIISPSPFAPHLFNPDALNNGSGSRCGGARNGGIIMTRQMFRERECIHRDEGADGDFYNGVFYIQALQRLRVDQAVKIAGKVSSFFWADAPHIVVWLCDACAAELHLTDTPRAIVSSARRA